jgi:hypothetical protein
LTHRGRAATFTRFLQSAKAATLLDFGRRRRVLSLLTARGVSSNLFSRRDLRLPGPRDAVPGRNDRLPAGRPGRAPRRARLPMRRSATHSRHIYKDTIDEDRLDSPRKRDVGIRLSYTIEIFVVRSHQRAPARVRRDRQAGTPAYGEGVIDSCLVRTSGSRPSTSRTVVSLIFVDRVAVGSAGASHHVLPAAAEERSTILLTARGGLIHGT